MDVFHELVGRALVDKEFRAQLLEESSRVDAMKQVMGDDPTADQIDAVNEAIEAVDHLSQQFGGGVVAA